jgi:hypothetical protein
MAKTRCQGGSPCTECSLKGNLCIFDGPDLPDIEPALPDPEELLEYGGENDPINTSFENNARVDHYIHLYFAHFHPHWPILHRHTFSVPDEPPLLLQAVLMIGLWVSGSPAARQNARNLHSKLGLAISEQRVSYLEALVRPDRYVQFVDGFFVGQLGTIAGGRGARQRSFRQPNFTMADCNLPRHSSLHHILITGIGFDWSRTQPQPDLTSV